MVVWVPTNFIYYRLRPPISEEIDKFAFFSALLAGMRLFFYLVSVLLRLVFPQFSQIHPGHVYIMS